MRILKFITGVALMAALFLGCSRKAGPLPTVKFQGYGANGATFILGNPSKEPVVCRLQMQPGDPGGEAVVMIPAGGSMTEIMSARRTNGVSLVVTVMRTTPIEKFTVPMQ